MKSLRNIAGVVLSVSAPWAFAVARYQDALAPAGPQATTIYHLWVLMLAICTIVFTAVIIGVMLAIVHSQRGDATTPPDVSLIRAPEKPLLRSVIAAVGISVMLLLVLFAASIFTDRALANLPLANAVNLEITAHQWWWEVKYDNEEPSLVFTTANEIEIPVGRPVVARLHAADVIHSLWTPNLHGKKDLIPGSEALIEFRADKPGVYRGQCAEFCGYQHAWMAFHVIATTPAQFEDWARQQRQSAPEPKDDAEQHGLDVFLSSTCAMCHSIQGTTAQGKLGPDLTHVASRPSLGAGRLPNTADYLMAWIVNPQQFKPGVNMPAFTLPESDLKALVAYLRTLQ